MLKNIRERNRAREAVFVVPDVSVMSWPELRAYAAAKGVKTHHMTRAAIEAAVVAV